MERLLEILRAIHPGVEFEERGDLVDGGVLDSFDIISLVNDLSEAFGVEIDVEYIEPEHFNSVAAIAEMLEELGAQL